jgi:hypothetical protein
MMKALLETRLFWWLVAAVVYPLLLASFVLVAIMPPLNIVLAPVWMLVSAGVVGGVSNGIAEAGRRQRARVRRYAPGVAPVQRTNAL